MDDYFGGGVGDYDDTPSAYTDVAQICLKGHVINSSFNRSPEFNKKYCPEDGEPTITECPKCNKPIAGLITYSNQLTASDSLKRPAFCTECGKPYPWTEHSISVAKELVKEIEGISQEDTKLLEASIVEISKNDPQAELGAVRIRRILTGLSGATVAILKGVIIEIASTTARKVLLGY